MFTSFPKLFDKNFVIGFVLPVVVALFAFSWIFPEAALLAPLGHITADEKTIGGLTYVALIVYGISVLLMTTNTAQDRILEGYLPPIGWLEFKRHRHEIVRARMTEEYVKLMGRWGHEGDKFPNKDIRRADELKIYLTTRYPPARLAAMPTRFGNVTRAFEAYPFDVYGVDAAPVWLRLVAVMPAEFVAELQDARAKVNAFINLLYLTPMVAIAALGRTAIDTPWRELFGASAYGDFTGWHLEPSAVISVASVAIIPLFYELAIASVKTWGDVVKSAFDCFLPDLASKLGYATPRSEEERRLFWGQINGRFVYWQSVEGLAFSEASTKGPVTP